MRTLPALILLLSLALPSQRARSAPSLPIVNGSAATGQEAWAKSLIGLATKESDGTYSIYCTGTLYNASTVITAAHCLDESIEKVWVVFGLSEDAALVPRKATRQHMHDRYDPKSSDDEIDIDDIGFVKFSGGPPAAYAPMPILTDASVLQAGVDVLVAGYGVTDGHKQDESGTLRYAHVSVKDPQYGEKEVSTYEDEFATCNGDSGGPAMIAIGGRWFLSGVISRGDKYCREEGVYTLLAPYTRWLKANQ